MPEQTDIQRLRELAAHYDRAVLLSDDPNFKAAEEAALAECSRQIRHALPALLDELERARETLGKLPPWFLQLAAEFMEAYSDRLSSDGCDDYAVPEYADVKALLAMHPDREESDTDLMTYHWAVPQSIAANLKAAARAAQAQQAEQAGKDGES